MILTEQRLQFDDAGDEVGEADLAVTVAVAHHDGVERGVTHSQSCNRARCQCLVLNQDRLARHHDVSASSATLAFLRERLASST